MSLITFIYSLFRSSVTHNLILLPVIALCIFTTSLISASLTIRIAEQRLWYGGVACPICQSSHVNCGKMADLIQMPFGVVSGVGLDMGVLDFGGDRRKGRGSLGVNTMQKWRIDRLSTRV